MATIVIFYLYIRHFILLLLYIHVSKSWMTLFLDTILGNRMALVVIYGIKVWVKRVIRIFDWLLVCFVSYWLAYQFGMLVRPTSCRTAPDTDQSTYRMARLVDSDTGEHSPHQTPSRHILKHIPNT